MYGGNQTCMGQSKMYGNLSPRRLIDRPYVGLGNQTQYFFEINDIVKLQSNNDWQSNNDLLIKQ